MYIIGYSGHAYVAIDALLSNRTELSGYFDAEEKVKNPYTLNYCGSESDEAAKSLLEKSKYFISVGDNHIRRKIDEKISRMYGIDNLVNAIHKTAIISSSAIIERGILIPAGVVINPLSTIGRGVIVNTNATIEHECKIGDFAHIGPGAVLCGNVCVGENTFVGANAVVNQNIKIGKNVMIGSGCVVIHDIPDGVKVVGNPQRNI